MMGAPRSASAARNGPNGWPIANSMSPLSRPGMAWAPPWAGPTLTPMPWCARIPSSMAAHRAPVSAIGSAATRTVRSSPESLSTGALEGVAAESVHALNARTAAAPMAIALRAFFIEQASQYVGWLSTSLCRQCHGLVPLADCQDFRDERHKTLE